MSYDLRMAILFDFLPVNVTSLIQPLDQGVMINIKRHCKRLFILRLFDSIDEANVSISDFAKSINLKIVAQLTAQAWQEILSLS